MTRARRSRDRAAEVSDCAWALMTDQPPEDGWELFMLEHFAEEESTPIGDPTLRTLWEEHGEAIVAAWAEERPGTRPSCWWRWNAPREAVGTRPGAYDDGRHLEPRRRLGGIGDARYENGASLVYPTCGFSGIPRAWVSQRQVDYGNGRARDVHGDLIPTRHREGDCTLRAIDPRDPPAYEAQAAYLERHGLLLLGERERLTAADFAPELVQPERLGG